MNHPYPYTVREISAGSAFDGSPAVKITADASGPDGIAVRLRVEGRPGHVARAAVRTNVSNLLADFGATMIATEYDGDEATIPHDRMPAADGPKAQADCAAGLMYSAAFYALGEHVPANPDPDHEMAELSLPEESDGVSLCVTARRPRDSVTDDTEITVRTTSASPSGASTARVAHLAAASVLLDCGALNDATPPVPPGVRVDRYSVRPYALAWLRSDDRSVRIGMLAGLAFGAAVRAIDVHRANRG